MSEPFLTVSGLHAGYGAAKVLHGLDFSVARGEVCAILGPNGAGKTTLLRALCGMVRVRGGVRLGDADITGRAPESIARLGVAHVPEGRGTFGPLTVEENLRLGAYTRRDRRGVAADLESMLDFFPILAEKLHEPAAGLSGGQQQMLAIARALMARPELLMLDEPSLGIAPKLVQQIFAAIAQIAASGVTILLVEQNTRIALASSQRSYVLRTGEIALHGSSKELAANPEIQAAYLGG